MDFPSYSDLPDFDPDDPFDARAEAVRNRVATAFADGGFVVTPENAQATLAGLTTGMLGVLLACTNEDGHRDVVAAVQQYLPHAANTCREMLGLPPLTDN